MNRAIAWVAFLAALMVSGEPAMGAVKVFLLAGQSNMVGSGTSSQIGSPYAAAQNDVQIWKYTGSWTALTPTFGNTDDPVRTGYFGPEVTFGYTINNLLPGDDIYLVKYAMNGTALCTRWDPTRTNDLYATFKSRVNAALANLTSAGKDYTIEGMVWMQGEADSKDPNDAAAYRRNLERFIDSVRTDFSTPDMRFVLGRITTPWGQFTDVVRAAQESVAASMSNVDWVDTDDLPMRNVSTKDYHYTTAGQIKLGIRFADAMVAPEPSAFALLTVAVGGLGVYAWRRRRKR